MLNSACTDFRFIPTNLESYSYFFIRASHLYETGRRQWNDYQYHLSISSNSSVPRALDFTSKSRLPVKTAYRWAAGAFSCMFIVHDAVTLES